MKLSILLILVSSTAALADPPALDYWVQDAQKQVTFAARPSVQVNLMTIAVDPSDYGQLNVSLSYDHNPEAQAEITALQAKFPGYQLARAMLDADGPLTLAIPSIGLDQPMAVSVSPNGPWFDFTTYLTQAQTVALKTALQSDPNAAAVTGNIQAAVPFPKIVEHVELGTDTCDRLVSGGTDLYSVMLEYSGVLQTIAGMTFQYATTSDALKRSVLDSCVDVSSASVSSFDALLAIPVAEKADKTRPYGETTQQVPSAVPLAVKYDLSVTLGGGPSS